MQAYLSGLGRSAAIKGLTIGVLTLLLLIPLVAAWLVASTAFAQDAADDGTSAAEAPDDDAAEERRRFEAALEQLLFLHAFVPQHLRYPPERLGVYSIGSSGASAVTAG